MRGALLITLAPLVCAACGSSSTAQHVNATAGDPAKETTSASSTTAPSGDASSVSVSSTGYQGVVRVDYTYASGPRSVTVDAAPVTTQTAHLILNVRSGVITRLRGLVHFDSQQRYDLCPKIVDELVGGGRVQVAPPGGSVFLDPSWSSGGHYKTAEPAVPDALVRATTTRATQECTAQTKTDRATFEIGYVPPLTGVTHTPNDIVGSLRRTYRGYDTCHPFSPLPPPPPVNVTCSWGLRWTLRRGG